MVEKVTFMVIAEDVARADVALAPDRIYYRFATESSVEDGNIPSIDDFEGVAARLIDSAMPREGENPLGRDLRMQFFVNNRISPEAPTEESLGRIIDILAQIAPEFEFLRGFKC